MVMAMLKVMVRWTEEWIDGWMAPTWVFVNTWVAIEIGCLAGCLATAVHEYLVQCNVLLID
jgi:hypothetical protein